MSDPYYADLNPDYPSRFAKRWAVFYRFDGGAIRRAEPRASMQFATRAAAERCAAQWNDAERDLDSHTTW